MARPSNKPLSPDEIEDIAENAANRAVSTLLMMLDVDADKPESIRDLRKTLEWARDARDGSDKAKKWVWGTIGLLVTSTITYLSWSFYEIFKAGLGK